MPLTSQLALPRGPLIDGRAARRRDARPPGESDARIRIIELRRVGYVERLRPEFDAAAFGEFEVLEQGEVHLLRAGAVQDIPAGITEDVLARRDERRSVEPSIDASRVPGQRTRAD